MFRPSAPLTNVAYKEAAWLVNGNRTFHLHSTKLRSGRAFFET